MEMTGKQEIICEAIAQHYGEEHQANKLIEELSECIRAVARADRGNIAEEIADVEIMLFQYKMLLGLDDEVEAFVEKKLVRQYRRTLSEKFHTDCAWKNPKVTMTDSYIKGSMPTILEDFQGMLPASEEWIRCEDALPDAFGNYLAWIGHDGGGGHAQVVTYKDGWNCYEDLITNEIIRDNEFDDVVAWTKVHPYEKGEK
jgi:NTP pyrophosphatase (non-canonical NTP hydrolase)